MDTTAQGAVSPRPLPQIAGVEHRWVTVRGVRLHIAVAGTGEPVVLLHGFPQHWYAWRHVFPLLAHRYQLIAVDLRGFGWSEESRGGYHITGLAEDVLALLDALGLDRARLMAHNWGGLVGFRMCLLAPGRVRSYLALNIVHPWPLHSRVLVNLWRMWFTAFVEYPVAGRLVLRRWPGFTRMLLRRAAADPALLGPADIEEFTEATRVSAVAGQSTFLQYVLREIPALVLGTYRSARLTVPAVILAGERDVVIPPGLLPGGERYSDDLTVEVVSGAGHHLHEERPDLVARAALELFEGDR
jgi:pimeloyl-ACP methyl ester carboxylesterase